MRIIIQYDDESKKDDVIENVCQFSLCGQHLEQNMLPKIFRQSMISDHNELIGLLKATELDILDHKKGVADVDTNKR